MALLYYLKGSSAVVEATTTENYITLYGGNTWTLTHLSTLADGSPDTTNEIWLSTVPGVLATYATATNKYILRPGEKVTFPQNTPALYFISTLATPGPVMNIVPGNNILEPV